MLRPGLQDDVTRIFSDPLSIQVPDGQTDLIELGLLDSLALVELLHELEQRFAVEIPLDDFDVESFRTVESIAAYVAQLGASADAHAA